MSRRWEHGAERPPVDRFLAPFRDFSHNAASGGVLLIMSALVAIGWANSPAADAYRSLLALPVSVGIGSFALTVSLQGWVNDALMAVFFLTVGLEIKRELLVGELATPHKAVLPIVAAAGGALMPALIFVAFAGSASAGWGIPIATDIAFALGVLTLLRSRVPLGLRVFLAALAIADDLYAVAVIAIFYTSDLDLPAMAVASAITVVLVIANIGGVRHPVAYAVLGIALWIAMFGSGIHPTVAGVLLAVTVPARTAVDPSNFLTNARQLLDHLERRRGSAAPIGEQHAVLWDLEHLTEQSQAPMLRMEHSLQPWVAYLILPLFALVNAGVAIAGEVGHLLSDPVVVGIALGLLVGKQVGITGTTWLLLRAGLAHLPDGVTMRHIHGVACLGGIGFTMSLLIAELAFGGRPELTNAKLAIFGASTVAAILGLFMLLMATRCHPSPESRGA